MSGEEDKEAAVTRHCNVEDSAEEGKNSAYLRLKRPLSVRHCSQSTTATGCGCRLHWDRFTWVVNPFSYLYLWHNWLTLWLQYEFTENTCIKHLNKELIWICNNIWFMFPGSRLRHGGSSLLCPHYLGSINTFMRPLALSIRRKIGRGRRAFSYEEGREEVILD